MPNIGDIIRADDLDHIIGQIIAFYGTTPPPHTLLCDGSEISRTTYSELFNVIGTREGEGDGATTFNLPDLRDRWIKYSGTENNVGEKIAEGLPNITGSFYLWGKPGSGCFYVAEQFQFIRPGSQGGYENNRGWCGFDASLSNPIYGTSNQVTPKSVALLPCIVYE